MKQWKKESDVLVTCKHTNFGYLLKVTYQWLSKKCTCRDRAFVLYCFKNYCNKNCIFFKYLYSELQDRKSIRLHFGIGDGRHVNGTGIWWVTLAQHSDRVSKCLTFMIRVLLTFFFRSDRKIAKSEYLLRHSCLSVRLSVCNTLAPTGRMYMKFNTSVFFGILPRIFKIN